VSPLTVCQRLLLRFCFILNNEKESALLHNINKKHFINAGGSRMVHKLVGHNLGMIRDQNVVKPHL
jgi:hypothetical protein